MAEQGPGRVFNALGTLGGSSLGGWGVIPAGLGGHPWQSATMSVWCLFATSWEPLDPNEAQQTIQRAPKGYDIPSPLQPPG